MKVLPTSVDVLMVCLTSIFLVVLRGLMVKTVPTSVAVLMVCVTVQQEPASAIVAGREPVVK